MSSPAIPPLAIQSHRTPNRFFTPTHIEFHDVSTRTPTAHWQSRRARKGRYEPKVARVHTSTESESHEITGRVRHVESELKPGLRADISFWVAVAFTLGSAVWVVNGFIVWMPVLRPNLAGITFFNTASAFAFIGGTIFEIGSYLMVVEALDRGREITFGTALGDLLHHRRQQPSHSDESVLQALSERAKHEVGRNPSPDSAQSRHGVDKENEKQVGKVNIGAGGAKGWIWWGKPLWHDLGYVAALVQLFAATVFWISTITGLPGVIAGFSSDDGSVPIVDVFFWTPQVIGGCGFIVSSAILMVEVQRKWYIPNFGDIGWQVAVWNLIGAFGFMLSGAFGYSPASGMVYESGVSTFWGSWAFLIGSGFQLWETIWREPKVKTDTPA